MEVQEDVGRGTACERGSSFETSAGLALAPGQRLERLCVRWAPGVSRGQTSLVGVLEESVSKAPQHVP